MTFDRRALVTGLGAALFIASPAIVRASSLMHIRNVNKKAMKWVIQDHVLPLSAPGPSSFKFCIIYDDKTGGIVYSGGIPVPEDGLTIEFDR